MGDHNQKDKSKNKYCMEKIFFHLPFLFIRHLKVGDILMFQTVHKGRSHTNYHCKGSGKVFRQPPPINDQELRSEFKTLILLVSLESM